MVVALVREGPIDLVEPRRRRADFLQLCVARLGLGEQVRVHASKVENATADAAIISARAVASLQNLLRGAAHCATRRRGGCFLGGVSMRKSWPRSISIGGLCSTWNKASRTRSRRSWFWIR
ncbi:class I SAM-dependent methyltransferase [Sphingomonas aurantiaca]|uniref:hypothetical protein n=1 Tax=Sphingomonas aurantiaca TaxID=185949 RepID=UPI002FDF6964